MSAPKIDSSTACQPDYASPKLDIALLSAVPKISVDSTLLTTANAIIPTASDIQPFAEPKS